MLVATLSITSLVLSAVSLFLVFKTRERADAIVKLIFMIVESLNTAKEVYEQLEERIEALEVESEPLIVEEVIVK